MSQIYVADKKSGISIPGLRMITKAEYVKRLNTTAEHCYCLEYEYKGLSKRVSYKQKDERDEMFDKIMRLLVPTES